MSVIGAVAVIILVIILLGLLLKSGEEDTNQLIIELEQQEQQEQVAPAKNFDESSVTQTQAKSVSRKVSVQSAVSSLLTIQLKNQQCDTDNQCRIIQVPRALGCALAMNDIGYRLLSIEQQSSTHYTGCLLINYAAQCLQSKCQKIADTQ